ncbi:redoxin domain-containing protein [Shewanella marina]|uniref:redoxin domain-containing protein n=1 Tax=Shewanella marina TaxID=487319 RepID=UPI000471F586|nr:redoxin domain-containing protein [Shewanella marina]
MKLTDFGKSPNLYVSEWLNTETKLSLAELQGQVVVVFVFQMLCPACVSHSMPQAKKVAQVFAHENVKVIGLHSVFEHHQAMQTEALKAFLYEYKINFAVAIDESSEASFIPKTMQEYQFQGTPTLLLIDTNGHRRMQHFGHLDDMVLAHAISELLNEHSNSNKVVVDSAANTEPLNPSCDDNGCKP